MTDTILAIYRKQREIERRKNADKLIREIEKLGYKVVRADGAEIADEAQKPRRGRRPRRQLDV